MVKDNTQLKNDFNAAKLESQSWRAKYDNLEKSSAR